MRHRRPLILVLLMLLVLIPLASVQAGRQQSLILHHQEVVPEGSGNPNMYGQATLEVNSGKGELCYFMNIYLFPYYNWPPTGATINEAPAGMNGPVRVDLAPSFGPVGDTTVSDCLDIGKQLARDIQKHPAHYYLLVTSEDYPDGAARAQLSK
ncbi:MAG: CHRD domain-containing protein [Candidatus Promineifilaceae bacterium]|nr:CHRD domain-containing protein [Candidatus Promineifilaceae bacterium]